MRIVAVCTTGNARMPFMRQLPVVPVCRGLISCTVGQIRFTFSRVSARKRDVSRSSQTLSLGCGGRVGLQLDLVRRTNKRMRR